jgi:hypothetical protein
VTAAKKIEGTATRRVWAQRWMSRDSWSGPEDEGASLHPSRAHLNAHVRAEIGDRSGPTPEYYVCTQGSPREIEVDAALYLKVLAAGKEGHHLSSLEWRERELEAELADVRERKARCARG